MLGTFLCKIGNPSVMSDITADFSFNNIPRTSSFVVLKLVKLISKSILNSLITSEINVFESIFNNLFVLY